MRQSNVIYLVIPCGTCGGGNVLLVSSRNVQDNVSSDSLSGLLEWDRSAQQSLTLPELFLELSEAAASSEALPEANTHRRRSLQQTLAARVPDVAELLHATGHRRERVVLR